MWCKILIWFCGAKEFWPWNILGLGNYWLQGYIWLRMFLIDHETCLLLAVPIYFREDNGNQRYSTRSLLSLWQNMLLGKKMPLPWLLTICCPYWTSTMQKKVTVKHFQDKGQEQFIRISCFIENPVTYSRSVGWKWQPLHSGGNLGDCPSCFCITHIFWM